MSALLLATTVVWAARPAYAVNCFAQQQIFSGARDPSGAFGPWQLSSGDAGRLYRIPNTLDTACAQWNYQTINWLFNDALGYYYELGFQEVIGAGQTSTGTHNIALFDENALFGGHVVANFSVCGLIQTFAAGTVYFRTYSSGGAIYGEVQCPGATTWTFLHSIAYSQTWGIGRSETERFPDTDGYVFKHAALQYRDIGTGTWFPWKGVGCWGDTNPAFQMQVLSTSSWNTIGGAAGC